MNSLSSTKLSWEAARFMDAVGVKVFGKQWTATDIKAVIRDSNPYFVNNSDDGVMRKKLVQLIIIEALESVQE